MPAIAKTPIIHTILSTLDSTQKGTLKTLIDSPTIFTSEFIGLNETANLKAKVGTISAMSTEFIQGIGPLRGILIYPAASAADQRIWFLSFNCSNCNKAAITEITFNGEYGYKPTLDTLTVEELRRALDDSEEAQGDEWVQRVKPHLDYNNNDGIKVNKFSVFADNGSRMIDANSTNKITSLYGTVKIGSTETPTDLEIKGDVTVVDRYGDSLRLVPQDVAEDLGKTLIVGTTGLQWESKGFVPPTSGLSNGTYVLKCVVVDGTPTVSWVLETSE